MTSAPSHLTSMLRKSAKWLILLLLVGAVFFRVKFASVPVTTYRVKAGPIIAETMGTGTLEARVKTTISPRIQERLINVLVDQNDSVSAGQILARLDDGELKQQVAVAQAALAAARATAERVRVDEARAQAVENQAKLDHRRVLDLLTNNVSSQADFDKVVEQLKIAESELQRARASTAEAQQQLITAEQSLGYHRERLAFTEIVSPYDGLITRRDRDPGGVVVPGSSILQLISTNEIWVSAWVDETAMARLNPGQPTRVIFRSEPATAYRGEVARLGREADRETREFLVDVRVNELPKNWAIGQRAEVFIETGRKQEAAVLPLMFLTWRAGIPGAILDRAGRAAWQEVKLGLRGLDEVEVLEGVTAGDVVCKPRDPKRTLVDGQRVRAAGDRTSRSP